MRVEAAPSVDPIAGLLVIECMRPLALALVLITIACRATAEPVPHLVPPGWHEEATPNWRGRRFVSPDGRSWLTTSTRQAHPSLDQDMDAIAYRPGERVTYQQRGKSWIAVSGFKGSRIFYRKSNLACDGTEWHHIELEYPASHKRRMDATVTRIAHDMTAFNRYCSPGRNDRG